MSDSISRADAIKAVEDLPNAYNGWSDTYDKACIIGVIEELPSADDEWIPCSERLPKEYAQYLVCLKSGECYVYWLEDSDWARWMAEKEGILAWMPLPKPYREDGEV